MYTDPFIHQADIIDGIRMASMDDIVAMKINAISGGGRKKDYWDIYNLFQRYSLKGYVVFASEKASMGA